MSFEVLHSEVIYRGRAFNVLREAVQLPDGGTVALDVIEHPGSVAIVPVDAEGNVHFVRQYRHPAREMMLELPAGTLETGEDPEVCAHRELREEIGMSAGKMEPLGDFYLAPGYSSEHMYVYLATRLEENPLPGDEDEFLSVEIIPAKKALEMLTQGAFKDAKSLAALALAQAKLHAPA
ncbi:MAG: NUDIX hydrolase [Chloroflexota bacterium]